MNKLLVLPMLCCTGLLINTASAHHAWPVNQERLVTVQGTVTDFDWSNPHPMISIDVVAADGSTEKWRIGGPAINRMERNGWSRDTVKPGDMVTGTGFQFSNGEKIIRLERVVLADNTEILVYARR
jgi:hypothetical protein